MHGQKYIKRSVSCLDLDKISYYRSFETIKVEAEGSFESNLCQLWLKIITAFTRAS